MAPSRQRNAWLVPVGMSALPTIHDRLWMDRAQELLVIVGAQSVFAQQEVTLPAMDVEGTRTVPVYRNIIEYLNNNAALIDSARILTKGDQENILKKYNEVLEQRGNDRKNNRGVRK